MSIYSACILADAPVVYYRLGELSGTAAVDQMGVQDGLYNLAGITQAVAGPLLGDTDKAITLDGANGYITIADNAALDIGGGSAVSIEVWLSTTSAGSTVKYIYAASSGIGGFGLSVGAIGLLRGLALYWDGQALNAGGPRVDDGLWHHVVAVASGALVTIYKDGLPYGPYATSGSPGTTYSGSRIIGAATNLTVPWPGNLDEFALYNYALSASRVLLHYQYGTQFGPGNPPTPTARGSG